MQGKWVGPAEGLASSYIEGGLAVSNPPEEPTDFGVPDFLSNSPQPPEGEPMGPEVQPEPGEEPFGPSIEEMGEGPIGPSMEEMGAEPFGPSIEEMGAEPFGPSTEEMGAEPFGPSMEMAEETGPSMEIAEEKSEEAAEEEPSGPTFWQRLAPLLDTYTVILLLSLVAILVAVALLGLELSVYQWDIKAKSVTGG